jgi:GNAT superfamily N-acetyltransferase
MLPLDTHPAQIRAAQTGDIEGVHHLLIETWHDTYDALLGAARVDEITGQWHAVPALMRQLAEPGTTFLVAFCDGILAGHAYAFTREPSALILARLYILPRYQRQGIGSGLLAAVIARHPGSRVVRLQVEAENINGISFYRTKGFESRGERLEQGARVLEMEKSLL